MEKSLVRNVNEKRCSGQVTSDATATNPFGRKKDAKNPYAPSILEFDTLN